MVTPGASRGQASPSHPQAEAASEGLGSRKKPSADVRKAPEHPAHDRSLAATVVTPARHPVPLGNLPAAGTGPARGDPFAQDTPTRAGKQRAPAHCTSGSPGVRPPPSLPPPSPQQPGSHFSFRPHGDFARSRQQSTVSTALIKVHPRTTTRSTRGATGQSGGNCLQNRSQKAAGGCAGSSAPGLSAQSRGSLSAGTGAPVAPRQRGSVLPARDWDGFWWLTAAASMTPRQTGEETQGQAPGCAGVLAASQPPPGSPSLWVAVPRVRAGTVIWGGSREKSLPHSHRALCGAEVGKKGPLSC